MTTRAAMTLQAQLAGAMRDSYVAVQKERSEARIGQLYAGLMSNPERKLGNFYAEALLRGEMTDPIHLSHLTDQGMQQGRIGHLLRTLAVSAESLVRMYPGLADDLIAEIANRSFLDNMPQDY